MNGRSCAAIRSTDAPTPVALGIGARIAVEESLHVILVDAGHLQCVLAVLEPVPPFSLRQEALPCVVGRRDREIVIGRQRPVVWNGNRRAEVAGLTEGREEEPALPFDGRIGRREIGQPGDRGAEELEPCVLE